MIRYKANWKHKLVGVESHDFLEPRREGYRDVLALHRAAAVFLRA